MDDYLLFREHLQAADRDNLIRQSQIVAFVWRLDWINDHALVSAVISDSPTMSIPLHDDDYQYRWNMAIEEVANYDDPARIVMTYFVHIQLISQQAPLLQDHIQSLRFARQLVSHEVSAAPICHYTLSHTPLRVSLP